MKCYTENISFQGSEVAVQVDYLYFLHIFYFVIPIVIKQVF